MYEGKNHPCFRPWTVDNQSCQLLPTNDPHREPHSSPYGPRFDGYALQRPLSQEAYQDVTGEITHAIGTVSTQDQQSGSLNKRP